MIDFLILMILSVLINLITILTYVVCISLGIYLCVNIALALIKEYTIKEKGAISP